MAHPKQSVSGETATSTSASALAIVEVPVPKNSRKKKVKTNTKKRKSSGKSSGEGEEGVGVEEVKKKKRKKGKGKGKEEAMELPYDLKKCSDLFGNGEKNKSYKDSAAPQAKKEWRNYIRGICKALDHTQNVSSGCNTNCN